MSIIVAIFFMDKRIRMKDILKAIAELVNVSVKLAYVFVFYPSRERAENIIDPQYDGDEYGSGETVAALKDEWNVDYREGETVAAQKNTKKILKES